VFLGSMLGTLVFVAVRLLAGMLRPEPAGEGPRGAIARGLETAGFLVEGEGAGLQDQIPFGSFLALGAALSCLWGERIIAAYLAFTGLKP